VAPGQEAGKIGLEIRRRESRAGKYRMAPNQDATVPQLGPGALLVGKLRRNLRVPRLGVRPRPWLHRQIKRGDAMNDRRRHSVNRLSSRKPSLGVHPRGLLDLIDEFIGVGLAD